MAKNRYTNVIYITNVSRLIANISAAQGDVLKQIGAVVALSAGQQAPVDTGLLSGSLDYYVESAASTVVIGTPVPYAPFQEFGTGQRGRGSGTPPPSNYKHGPSLGHVAQPFLEPAVMRSLPEIQRIARRGFKQIDRLGGISVRFPDDVG